jgi:triosephosphate isomerase
MERLVKLKPDFVGYEISELIGGEVSITDSNPKAIKHAVELCGKIPLIVGAGVHQAEDLKKAMDLGAKGVLVSSAVVLAENPRQKLEDLISKL